MRKANRVLMPAHRRTQLYKAQGHNCYICGLKMRHPNGDKKTKGRQVPYDKATIDHVFPKSLGGYAGIGNILLACHRCNTVKGNAPPTQAQLDHLIALNWALNIETIIFDPQLLKGAIHFLNMEAQSVQTGITDETHGRSETAA